MRASAAAAIACPLCPFVNIRCGHCIVHQNPTRLYVYIAAGLIGAMMATLIGAVT